MSTLSPHATVIAELASLTLIDATYGKAKLRLSAKFGRNGVALLELIADPEGILVQTYKTDLRFLIAGPGIVAEPQFQFRIPPALAGRHGSLIQLAAAHENAAADELMARFRTAVEAPELAFLRGDHDLYLKFFKALRLFRDSARAAAFIDDVEDGAIDTLSPEDYSDLAVVIATLWFHPIEWTASVIDGVLVHRPVNRKFVWDTKPHTTIGHEIMEEVTWLRSFLERACSDLGLSADHVDRAMEQLGERS